MAKTPAKVAAHAYDASAIQVFKGLDGVRKRPGMYLGSTDDRGVVHTMAEIVGNSSDEATNGHGKIIRIAMNRDGSLVVADEGRGIPVGNHPDHPGTDTLTLLFTELHSGGKFDKGKENYTQGKIGTHGVGLGVVNAMSEYLEVWSWRNRTWNYQRFERGKPKTAKPGPVKALPANLGITHPNQGTIVRWKPDLSVFSKGAKFNQKMAFDWLNDISWLIGDVQLEITVEGKKPVVIHRPNGLQDRFAHECELIGVEPIADPFIYHSAHLDVLIGWTNNTEEVIYSAVASIRTAEGGTHVKGLESAISLSFADSTAGAKTAYDPKYLRTGMIAVVNVKMDEPKFNSQDKVKLVSEEARESVINELYAEGAHLWTWLGKNKELREAILNRAAEFTSLHEGFKASKKLAAEYKVAVRGGKILLPKDLMVSTTRDIEAREMYIVEGGSAGGSADDARYGEFQEVYPLSGKPLNVLKEKSIESALYSQKIKELLQCIGYDPANPKKYRVGKAILLCDADDDGSHIAALVSTLLQAVIPDFIEAGRLFACNAPLYLYRTDKGNVYGANLGDLRAKTLQTYPRMAFEAKNVTRIKGWGELDPPLLRDIAFAKTSRKLTRVTPASETEQKQRIIALMGNDVSARRILLGLAA